MVIVLKYDVYGFPLWYIDTECPLYGVSLWRCIDKNTSEVVRDVPKRFAGAFNKALKEKYKDNPRNLHKISKSNTRYK